MQKDDSHFILVKNPNGIWYYYAYDENGRKIRREVLDEISRRIRNSNLLEKPDVGRMYRMTFLEFSEPFWIWEECPIVQDKIARGGHYSPNLCAANRKSMEKHILPYFGDKLLQTITRKDVNQWVLSLPDKDGISSSTANKMLSMLKQMLRVAVYEGIIPSSPAETMQAQPMIPKDGYLSIMYQDSDMIMMIILCGRP